MKMLLLILLLPQFALAATISGTVYDLSLDPTEAIVTINTSPEQRVVAKDGTYSFNVPAGEHMLEAVASMDGEDWKASENLSVKQDGDYTVDLILAPRFEEVDELGLEEADIPTLEESRGVLPWSAALALIVLLGIGLYLYRKKSPAREDDEFKAAVLKALKDNGGRATQKQIRQRVPFSEAKVSLVLTELEDEGRVRKIKKGRGNIIVIQ